MQGLSPSNPAPSQCFFHHHVWAFLPGVNDWFTVLNPSTRPPNVPSPYGQNAWVRMADVGANGGPVPAGRTEHVAGNLGDQLYIYGGFTATGPVTPQDALWTYNIVSQTWSNIYTPGGNVPPTGQGIFQSGTFVARHLYVWQENYFGSTEGQLWRFQPNAMLPAPAPVLAPTPASTNAGHTWGIVIGILIGLANLYFLWLLVQNAGVDVLPSSLSACIPSMGGRSAAAPGYYSAPTGATADAAAYKAPSGPEF
jgi:hypothetical protein